MKTARHREPVNVNCWPRLMAHFRGVAVMLVGSLLLAACVEDDPRYPVYYHYRVDVKVDGAPVSIERVIKCTGTLVTDWEVSPGTKTGADYANPPVIGAYVPGTSQAVYTPVPNACLWASATPEQIEADKKQVHRFLVSPLTPENKYLPPDSKLPVLWASDDKTFDRMEYYVSKRALSGQDSHVEFIKAFPPEIVDEAAFEASEKRAETESPDLTPFIFPRDQKAARELQIYKERFGLSNPTSWIVAFCHGAWRIPRNEWSEVPGLTEWVAVLPKESVGYYLPSNLRVKFSETIAGSGARNGPSLMPIGTVTDRARKFSGRFATYEGIHPVIPTDQGEYVDLSVTGFFGCNYDVLNTSSSHSHWGRETVLKDLKPNSGYSVRLQGSKLWASLPDGAPMYVPALDEIIVFRTLKVGSTPIDEPVVKGWKE
jgi:hypothetical protein